MAPLADFIIAHVPLPTLPPYLTTYINGLTPMSTPQEVFPTLAAYLVVIFGIQWFMKDRAPLKLQYLFQLHNVILSSGSLLLMTLILEEVLPMVWEHGVFWGMCHTSMWTSHLETYYMVNYYFKYLELLDTVFLALKKKPLAFLHVFHHSATALLCYTQLNGKTSVQWIPISINLAVHVLMYYYYYATAGGAKIWYDIALKLVGTAYNYYAAGYFPHWPNFGTCAGTETAAVFGCLLLSSYLVLFINFYIQTYKKPVRGKGKAVANGKANGHAYVLTSACVT
ncbi:hypothetical protein PHLCEN_2v443 [Hermanssonia centrifuga]|uniref:Elongation of fatty acids protein n=1 Tax=Hermanssonia centrifuga TaxID=98765 RepID=A0A2R6S619_9APHY|nr:hypothetical protein PHLCEN_2v443 [Hermanssonia centrifuga]